MASNQIPGSVLRLLETPLPQLRLARRVTFKLPPPKKEERKARPSRSSDDSVRIRYCGSPPPDWSGFECLSPSSEDSFLLDPPFGYPSVIPGELSGAALVLEAGPDMKHLMRRYRERLNRKVPRTTEGEPPHRASFVFRQSPEDREASEFRDVRSTHPALLRAAEVCVTRIPGKEQWYWVVHEPVGLPHYTHAADHPVHVWPNAVNNGKTQDLGLWKDQSLDPRRFLSPSELDSVRASFPPQIMGIRVFMSGCVVALFNRHDDMAEAYKLACPARMANFEVKYAQRLGIPSDDRIRTSQWLAKMVPWMVNSPLPERTNLSVEPEPSAIAAAMEGEVVYHVSKGEIKHSIVEGVEYVWDGNTCRQTVSLIWRRTVKTLGDEYAAIRAVNDLGALHDTLCGLGENGRKLLPLCRWTFRVPMVFTPPVDTGVDPHCCGGILATSE